MKRLSRHEFVVAITIVFILVAMVVGATQRGGRLLEKRDKDVFEVKVYPAESCEPDGQWRWIRRNPLVFGRAFYTRREAFDYARLVVHQGIEVEFCSPGPGIRVFFPTTNKITIRKRTCDFGEECAFDEPCVPQ